MGVLENCKPADVFGYFETICGIPHGSWNEKALSDHIKSWAEGLGLEVHQDAIYNLIIKKSGTTGYENVPAIILQAHIDMVCEKNNDVEFDFENQGLNIYIDGDFVKARGTTLGGDNGVAVAMIMAVLADSAAVHPPLEVVLTTVEEVGMDGALAIDASLLTAKTMLNIDNSDEGIFITGCAGGAKIKTHLPIQKMDLPSGEHCAFTVFVGGLQGGHSGIDIHLERGNSNKLLGRALSEIQVPFYIADITGGSKDNAIPREAGAKIFVNSEHADALAMELAAIEYAIKKELKTADGGVFVRLDKENCVGEKVFDAETQSKTIAMLMLMPSGVQHMSADMPGLVEASNNLGVVRIVNNNVVFTCAVRSSVESRKWAVFNKIKMLGEVLGAKVVITGNYPGWEYSPKSPIRDMFVDVWTNKFGQPPKVMAVHAGLECGVFASKIPGLDMISFGPDMFGLHTPDERVSISSVERCHEFFKEVLKRMK